MEKPAGPLRCVIRSFVDQNYSQMEELECGHTVRRKQDIYGYTNAYRRRCCWCAREMAAKGGLEPPTS